MNTPMNTPMNTIDAAHLCKILGDSHRLQIVQMLSDGELCACKILERFNITQPTLSHHMKVLCDGGLVSARKEGKWSQYSLNTTVLAEFETFITSLTPIQGGI